MPPASPEGAAPAGPRVLTVPFGASFLDALADGLLDGGLVPGIALRGDPAGLAATTIFLPTRRAGAALAEVLVARSGGAALLPRILPLGEAEDEDDLGADADALAGTAPDHPIPERDRVLVLARLIRHWAQQVGAATVPREPGDPLLIPGSPADAVALAAELARLIDSFATENVPWSRLAGLVPEELDRSWQLITDFLKIAATAWPAFLAAAGLADRAALRNARLQAFAARLAARPSAAPVIVAGSTGSNPATADLMAAVARLPKGAVVLPGLDRGDLDAAAWAEVAADDAPAWTHPQHGLARTLAHIGIEREAVGLLGAAPDKAAARRRLVAEALRPAATTEAWAVHPLSPEETATALEGVAVVAAEGEHEEALAAAVLLREALAEPDRRAALVTPDRRLARRVAAELARFGLAVEDSAGLPLSETPAGVLARLIADAAAADLAAPAVLPLLKHPDATLGKKRRSVARAVAAIELAALRGPPPRTGAAGLAAALAEGRRRAETDRHAHPALRRIRPWEWGAATQHLARLAEALAALCRLGEGPSTLAALAAAHAEALAAIADDALDCDEMLAALDAIAEADGADMPVALTEYPALITRLLAAEAARRPAPADARVAILGTLEARLLAFDRVVLGGLIEGSWPPAAHNDPWLSRPMRKDLGLPPPEWRIGLSAHDFQEMLGNRDVALTWSAKADGAPTVPARWLQRLAVVGGQAWVDAIARGEAAIVLARSLDEAGRNDPPREPMPAPPLALRPDRLSVTAIETLMRDPYAIYARHILRLDPLEPVAAPPDAGDRGEIMHAAFARFVAEGIDPAAPDAEERLLAIGRECFAPLADRPEIRAFWWPRFCRAAAWFLGWSRERQGEVAESIVEQAGRYRWTTAAEREFALTARADRFDRLADGTLAVIDYKTGTAKTAKEVAAGIAPQLPLEAAMAMAGGFPGVPASAVSDLVYVRLTGGREPGKDTSVAGSGAGELAAEALAGARELIDRYEDEAFPYRSLRHPLFRYRDGGPYEHLARFQEWAKTGEEEDEP